MDGKVIIITGGAQGIGKSFGELLLENGATVVVGDINEVQGNQTVEEFTTKYGKERALFKKCNVVSKDDMESLFKFTKNTFGNIDVFLNNAGICDEGRWELMLDINLKAMISGIQVATQYMARNKGGKGGTIINTVSSAAVASVPFIPVYAASKHGILAYARSVATHPDFAATEIRMNNLLPNPVATDLIHFTETQVVGLDLQKQVYEELGIQPAINVAQVMLKILKNDSYNAESFLISTKGVKRIQDQFQNFDDMTNGSVAILDFE